MRYTLYSDPAPNPYKVHAMLEELGVAYRTVHVDFAKSEQKTPEFLALNPNGRVPVLIDHENDDFVVIESAAILIYLAEAHGAFLPAAGAARSETLQWLMWMTAGLGPMLGQRFVFKLAFHDEVEAASRRYDQECRRLLGVLDGRLNGRDFVAGDHSIADMAIWGWMMPVARFRMFDLDDVPNVKAWFERVSARDAYRRAAAAAGSKTDDERMTGIRKAVVGLDTYVAPGAAA